MDKFWVVTIMAFYTLVIVFGIHYYEKKIKQLKIKRDYWHDLVHKLNDLSAEKTKEYLIIQKTTKDLDQDNHLLKNRISALQQELISLRNQSPIQYESSGWPTNQPVDKPQVDFNKLRRKGMGFARIDELDL